MPEQLRNAISRRRFLKIAGAAAVAASGPAVIIPGHAQPKTLKILKPNTTSSIWDRWFHDYAKAWGKQNATEVIVDDITWGEVEQYIVDETTSQHGHDIIYSGADLILRYEEQLIDHREIYEECERLYGKPHETAIKSTYNPKLDKFFCFCKFFGPTLTNYRQDLWGAIGAVPDTWEAVWTGGRKIRLLHEAPVGINWSPSPSISGEATLRSILYSFGASEQTADHTPALKSKATLEAIKFAATLATQAATPKMLVDETRFSNIVDLLAGTTSMTLSSSGTVMGAELKKIPIADKLRIAPPPQGPKARLAPWLVVDTFSIWRFAKNIEGAKQFLVDYTGQSREEFLATKYRFSQAFPGAILDLETLVSNRPDTNPPDKYQALASTEEWSTNHGHPGYYNPAISEIYRSGLIPKMFIAAATGKMTPEEALTQADQEVRKIYDKWRTLGKV